MVAPRLSRLIEEATARGLDCLALVPGPNLFYLTGASFHLSERPVLLLVPVDRRPAVILPTLEAPKVESGADLEGRVFPYTDEEGYTVGFQQACTALELANARIGVEALRLRLLEARALERYAPGCELVPADEVLASLRMCKDAEELARMREAVAVTEAALRTTLEQVRAGMTEQEVARWLMVEMLRAGGETALFPPIVVGGPNAASPHAVPSDHRLCIGEMLMVDCGVTVAGYGSDITRTFAVVEPDPEWVEVYEIVREANAAGRAVAGPGVPAQDVDRAARAVIEAAGYGEYFIHRTGHGLGLEGHEPPYIVEGNETELVPGMTFTVEPGIYLPGRGGVRIEDDVVITEEGAEILTTFPRELMVIG